MDNLNANTQPNTSMPSMPQIPRMISIQQVEDCIGLSSSTIYDMLNKRSKRYDPTFPVQVKMTKGRVAWVESEVAAWIESKMADRIH
ncbi:AlpA family phage regulatory protein [Psychrobacter immobilis]|jgi:prophage regulatory protein|uniref:helix-turn-helix transcriptional regulator n=1 Tax=Psychrobacter TaxID=497 RepID=UPI001D11073D|nr:AlpA family phage regulatory protein [Psychrobacter immobilis]